MAKFIANEQIALMKAMQKSMNSGKTFNVVTWKKAREMQRLKIPRR